MRWKDKNDLPCFRIVTPLFYERIGRINQFNLNITNEAVGEPHIDQKGTGEIAPPCGKVQHRNR